jgi:antitoxin component of MazEF toxin-antitoxin module
MLKKPTKHGNSLALVIDRPILDLLKIDPETLLDVSTDRKRLIISPADACARRKKFDAAQEWAAVFLSHGLSPGRSPGSALLDFEPP